MSAQEQGDSARTAYGAVGEGSTLPNGVIPAVYDSAPMGTSTSDVNENPNMGERTLPVDAVLTTTATEHVAPPPHMVDPPYERAPEPGASVFTPNVPAGDNGWQQNNLSPQTPTSAIHVQEFYSAQTGPTGSEVQGVRWMARFSEFLRSTATRGAQGMDRMLDGLGIPPLPQREARITPSPSQRPNISPPEDLPQPVAQPPPDPGSWNAPRQITDAAPLFGQQELMQMRAQLEYPQLYGPSYVSDGGSEHSSRLQAEIQRQLEDYKARQQQEVERLQSEIRMLKEERDQERSLRMAPPGIPLPSFHTDAQPPEQQSANAPGGLSATVPQSACVPGGLPTTVPQSANVSGGLSATVPQSAYVPNGLPASVPQSAYVPGGLPATVPQSANAPGGLPASVPQSAYVPGGLPATVPQSAN